MYDLRWLSETNAFEVAVAIMVPNIEEIEELFKAENKKASDTENIIVVIVDDKIENKTETIYSEINKWSPLLSEKKIDILEIRNNLLSHANSSDETESLLDLISKSADGAVIIVETIGDFFTRKGISRINVRYDLDLDYVPWIYFDDIELLKIIEKADSIIAGKIESNENMARAYLKKAQCMQKLEELSEHSGIREQLDELFGKDKLKDTIDKQEQIKNIIEKVLELIPDIPEAFMQMGKIYQKLSEVKEGNIDEAVAMYTKAIQLKPDYAAVYNNLGCLYSSEAYLHEKNNNQEENLNKAIEEFTKAIRIRPSDESYYFNRGSVYSKLKNHERAINDYSNTIDYSSDKFKKEVPIYYFRGQEYMEIKDYEKAIADFSEEIRLSPYTRKALLMRGFAYLYSGKKDEAKVDFDEYLRKKWQLENLEKINIVP
jgi:tetratricopeptide (TPR) repeat protein